MIKLSTLLGLLAVPTVMGAEVVSATPSFSRAMVRSDIETSKAVVIEKCGRNPLLNIEVLDIEPWAPLVKGQPTTIELKGNLQRDITQGATMTVHARWNGIKLIEKTVDICDSIASIAPCPIKAGEFYFKDTMDLPSFLPSGNYQVSISAKTAGGKDNIFCGTVKGSVRADDSEKLN